MLTLSPGCFEPTAVVRSLALRIASPPNFVTTSPALSPASAAGEPLWTRPIWAPGLLLAVPTYTPRYGCSTFWPLTSFETTEETAFEGTAKPTPSLPPESLSIWLLTPTTSPDMLRSGPPELPWLIAASVWMTPGIVNLLTELISRFRALTIPAVTVSSRPNGLPIATTPSPTSSADESPRASGCSLPEGASTLITARSDEGSAPTSFAVYLLPSLKVTEIELAPSTTWSFVTIW